MYIDGGFEKLQILIEKQLESFTYYNSKSDSQAIVVFFEKALLRLENCLMHSCLKHSHGQEGEVRFSPFHQGQYAMFLYFLANTIWKVNPESPLPKYISFLNKALNNIDIHHTVNMPDIFFTEHPLGTICSKATYGDHFFCLQGCTVGTSSSREPLVYPVIGNYVTMLAHSSILGNSLIGDHVICATGTIIKNEIIPDYCLVFGQSPNLKIKRITEEQAILYFRDWWREI